MSFLEALIGTLLDWQLAIRVSWRRFLAARRWSQRAVCEQSRDARYYLAPYDRSYHAPQDSVTPDLGDHILHVCRLCDMSFRDWYQRLRTAAVEADFPLSEDEAAWRELYKEGISATEALDLEMSYA